MSEWFETAFGEEYLELYAHRNAAEAQQAVDLILDATSLKDRSLVLDIPCGAGRHLQAFRTRGMQAYGFDLSWPLLREAVQSAVPSGTVARGDLRAMTFRQGMADLVVNLFSSLGYFSTDEENLSVLHDLVRLVRPGGWIAIDFMHSEYLRANLQPESYRVLSDGTKVSDSRWLSTEPLLRVNKRTLLQHPDRRENILEESVRLFSPDDLRLGLQRNGVVIHQEFGSYHGEPFSQTSSRIIILGQRQ